MKGEFKRTIFIFSFSLIIAIVGGQIFAQNIRRYEVSIYSWLKNIYYDSTVVQTGSLLSEPFQKKGNLLPSVIFLSGRKVFKGNASTRIKNVFSIKDSLICIQDYSKALKQAENEKMISFDSSVFSDKKIHVLGRLYLNGVYANRSGSLVFIDHSYSANKGKSVFSAIVALVYKNGKWKTGKTVVYDMTN